MAMQVEYLLCKHVLPRDVGRRLWFKPPRVDHLIYLSFVADVLMHVYAFVRMSLAFQRLIVLLINTDDDTDADQPIMILPGPEMTSKA